MVIKSAPLHAQQHTADLNSLLGGQLAFTPKEFAGLFGRSATWGYRQLYSGKIKKLGGCDSILIPRSELERFLSQIVAHE